MCMSIDEMTPERIAADLSYMEADQDRSKSSFWKWRLPGFQIELGERIKTMTPAEAVDFHDRMRTDGVHERVLAFIADRAHLIEIKESA